MYEVLISILSASLNTHVKNIKRNAPHVILTNILDKSGVEDVFIYESGNSLTNRTIDSFFSSSNRLL